MTFWQFAFKNVTRNARAYFAYFVSSAFSIAIFFSFAVYLFHPKLHMTDVNYALNILMTISEVIIVFFSFFFLLYSIGTFLKVRKKQFGILTVLGISQKQLKRLIFLENMLIGVLSIFFGIQFGLVFSQFFLLVTAKITHVPGLYLYWPTSAIILTIIIFFGLFILVSSFTPMLIRTRKAVRLLQEGEKQKRKKSICTHFSLWRDMFTIWICISSKPAIFYVTRRYCWSFVRRHQYICHSITCCSWDIFFLFTN